MRTLMLLRHAKSDWDAPTDSDQARPLNKRGRRSAGAMAKQIAKLAHPPQLIVASPAVRAMRTAEAVAEELDEAQLHEVEELYGAGPEEIIALAQHLPKDINSALLVGHNPGFEEAVHALGGDPDLLLKTCMLAVFEFDGPWSKLSRDTCRLVRVMGPEVEPAAAE